MIHKKNTILLVVGVLLLMGCGNVAALNELIKGADDQIAEYNLIKVSIKLNWRHSVQFLGFYMAEEQGFYAEEGLIVDFVPVGEISEIDVLANNQNEGIPVIGISSILQFSPLTYFAMSNSGIVTVNDFVGRTVAVKGDTGRANLERLLNSQGLTLDDVVQVEAGFDMTPFYEGEVDLWAGYITSEVVRARLNGYDLVTFPLYEYGVQETSVTLFTSIELLESDRDMVTRFTRASLRGWEWAIDNREEAMNLMLGMYPELLDQDSLVFHQTSFEAYIPLIQVPGDQIGAIDCEKWLTHPALAEIENTDGLCTTEIFDAATQ